MLTETKLVVSWPVGRVDVRALVRVYGGYQKDQKKNLVEVPVGTYGELVATFHDNEYNRDYGLVKFEVFAPDGQRSRFVWARVARWLIEEL